MVSDVDPLRDLAALFEFLPYVQFWIKDRKGRFLAANHAFLEHFGLKSMEELEGRTDFDVSPPNLAREYSKDDQGVLASGKTLRDKMELVREKHGGYWWYSTTKVPLRDARGQIWGTAGFALRLGGVKDESSSLRDISTAAAYMQEHLSEKLSVRRLAAEANLSVVQFERNFRKIFHVSPLKYFNRIRLLAAGQLLLHTDVDIGAIASQTGFADPSYFTKAFTREMRISPSAYRKKFGRRQHVSSDHG